jgi:hypothetical protein
VEERDKTPIRNWGRFASVEMESAYQATELPAELKHARFILWLLWLIALLILRQDFVLFGYSTRLYVHAGVHFAFLAYGGLALFRVRRSP